MYGANILILTDCINYYNNLHLRLWRRIQKNYIFTNYGEETYYGEET